VIASADYLLDFGPGAGDQGGEITASGTPKQLLKSKESLTGKYLERQTRDPSPEPEPQDRPAGKWPGRPASQALPTAP
jgi:excinuclease UvrABC ATPase subunit